MTKWTLGAVAAAIVLGACANAPAQIILASDWSGSENVVSPIVEDDKIEVGVDVGVEKEFGVYQAEDKVCYDECDKGNYGKGGKGGYGYSSGGAFFDVEFQFMRYFQEGGVADATGSPAQFDYDFTPKFEAGYVGPGGLGLRGRYWSYDGATLSAASNVVGVDAYYMDLEMFQQYDLTCHTCLEVSLGVRYADFTQGLGGPAPVLGGWQGWGGTIGLEAKRAVCLGNLYARGRLSVLMGDAAIVNVAGPVAFYAEGNTVTQTELGIGYEVSGCVGRALLSARIGAEWQNWSNVAPAATDFAVGADPLEDAGWAGLVLALGIQI